MGKWYETNCGRCGDPIAVTRMPNPDTMCIPCARGDVAEEDEAIEYNED